MTRLLYLLLRFSGLPFLFREIVQRNRITILVSHKLNGKHTEKTLTWLERRYNIIDLNELIVVLEKGQKGLLPKKALVLTFDDGHIENHKMLPVLKKMRIPVTIFLCSSIIDTNRHYWFMHKDRAEKTSNLKRIPNRERIKAFSDAGFEQNKEFGSPEALQKWQIEEMKPYVNFQSHTRYHPILPTCTEKEAREELFRSKTELEEHYKLKINAISYPNGDYSFRDIQLAKEAGYRCGLTVDFGFNTLKTDIFRLKRISIHEAANKNELIVKASGLWGFLESMNGHRQDFGLMKPLK
jgi:peptidoglycan/xylan/chitin deacetylase (PgdA/CDA1 family)